MTEDRFDARDLFRRARENLTQGVNLSRREDPDLLAWRGKCSFNLKEVDRALEDFQKALELAPSMEEELRPWIDQCRKSKGM
jgi:tetratricopeptide (TPR) repeat protein